nr:MAG TPA: hypothetical protein [Caudoviricetes sp.]
MAVSAHLTEPDRHIINAFNRATFKGWLIINF